MKLTVGGRAKSDGFALPTILLVSTVMLIVLVASVAATAASRVSLDSQYYNQLAQQAAQSGVARANECLKSNGYSPQWSTSAVNRNLRPDSDCLGQTLTGPATSAYVVGNAGSNPSSLRTKYTVEAPSGTGIGSILRVVGVTELVRTSSPNSVWRHYEQSLFLRIEPPKTVGCPTGFIGVPGDARFNTNDFCISKYEAKNVGGKAVSQADGLPWASLGQTDAITAAEGACSGCRLVSESQWLTLAHNVTNVASNWSGGEPGNGYLYSGHNDNSPANSLAASSNDSDGYFGTANSSGNQRRTLRLNNGEVIWDLAGNVHEFTTGQTTGGQPGPAGFLYRDWNSIAGVGGNFTPNPFPSFGTPAASSWTGASHGIGRAYTDGADTALRGFVRGGGWTNTSNSGVFTLLGHFTPSTTGPTVGFRIAFEPLSSITCPSGQVPVPGNSSFGTKDFCIGKYEAKNVGGVATSQAAGVPWTSITRADAATAASNACGSCRLVGEAEWLTVAHNALSVSSNWSSGTVGSGFIFSGHNDGSPASSQAAGTDDSNGYFGTSNVSPSNQRRTLRLNNGQVIWDLAGNVNEWTTGTISGGQPTPTGVWSEWNAMTMGTTIISPSPFPAFGTASASAWTSTNGLGRVLTNVRTDATPFLRSGNHGQGATAGIFALNLNPPVSAGDIGFRVVSDPIPSISCSGGYIAVPGDSRFGTTDFCVGKYEAKNVGGVATSQAAGLPWTSINQTNAIAAGSAACAKCRIIGEAEWMTIAHNIVSVPSNWSGGSVGSGFVFSGHGDNGPAGALAASTSDNDGYSGTGNVSPSNQRRTLTLTNGEVIWDFAGNVYEWTSAQINGGQPGPTGWAFREWNTVTDSGALSPNPFPAFGTPAASGWTSSQGLGRIYSNSSDATLRGFRRGGYWYNDGTSGTTGVFQLALNLLPSDIATALGFRVVEIK